ncbi:MAG TPA: toxin-antitoxin system HicB family antitoxin [Candidatus Limnocylindria bacterium]|nr:toxin-antitoxin system HicB family antitoxin [Candidatus Limnocylindria bacterium]
MADAVNPIGPIYTLLGTLSQRKSLDYYLGLTYPYTVIPDEGSFFIEFPDLPNCITQVETSDQIADMAEEIRTLWIETEYEAGETIPEPTPHSGYSGRFVVRVPRLLHRELAMAARRQQTSLNAYVIYLLSERTLAADLNARLERLEAAVSTAQAGSEAHRQDAGEHESGANRADLDRSAAD